MDLHSQGLVHFLLSRTEQNRKKAPALINPHSSSICPPSINSTFNHHHHHHLHLLASSLGKTSYASSLTDSPAFACLLACALLLTSHKLIVFKSQTLRPTISISLNSIDRPHLASSHLLFFKQEQQEQPRHGRIKKLRLPCESLQHAGYLEQLQRCRWSMRLIYLRLLDQIIAYRRFRSRKVMLSTTI